MSGNGRSTVVGDAASSHENYPSLWPSATSKYDYDHCIVASRTRQWFNRRDVYHEPISRLSDTRHLWRRCAWPSAGGTKTAKYPLDYQRGQWRAPWLLRRQVRHLPQHRSPGQTQSALHQCRLDRPGLRTGAHDDHLRHLPARDRRRAHAQHDPPAERDSKCTRPTCVSWATTAPTTRRRITTCGRRARFGRQ